MIKKAGLLKLFTLFRFFFKKPQHDRDVIIRKNVVGSFIFQFFTNLIGLLVVPLSLSYIDKEKYGIWINASVMVTWLQNMNFGMGFGMQNKVSEAVAKGEINKAKDYISIVYRYSTLIAAGLLLLGLLASFFINWNQLFNSTMPVYQLKIITLITFICFLVNFVFSNIIPLSNALQLSFVPKFFGLLINILTVIFLFWIGKFSHNNLILAAIALALPSPLIYFIGNIFFFKTKKLFKPSWHIQEKKHIKDVFSLGMKFFFMQIATFVTTQSGVVIITQYLGPAEVTPYSIINRYFYFAIFLYSLLINPYWAGITDAYFKNDFNWIKKALKKLLIAGACGTAAVILMFVFSFYLIPIWSTNAFDIYKYKSLVYTSAIFSITIFFSAIISIYLSALSLLRFQMLVQIAVAVLTIIISIMLIKTFHLGSLAVNITAIIGQIIFIILCGWKALNYTKLKLKTT